MTRCAVGTRSRRGRSDVRCGRASARPPGPGSRPPSPRPRRPRSAPGRRSRPAATRWWSPRPARARRSARSCGRSTGSPTTPPPPDKRQRCRVLYVSPLKALAVDVERNLRAPLTGIRHTAARLGLPEPDITVGVRSGDTPADRAPGPGHDAAGHPDHHARVAVPDAHLAGARGAARRRDRDRRRGARRGRHQARRPPGALAGAARRAAASSPAQRIGLSATVRPIEEVARFLGGASPVEVVAPAVAEGVGPQGRRPGRGHGRARRHRAARTLEGPAAGAERAPRSGRTSRSGSSTSIEQHRSTIVFANSRRLAERLTARFNEIAAERAGSRSTHGRPAPGSGPPAQVMAQSGQSEGAPRSIARAHHGSVSKEQRALIEDDLKRGRLPCVVATSSLELGIDMGAVDLVVQIESPPSVASALQRVGRAGHQVGEVSRGVLLPKHRADLVHTAVAVERMRAGAIESLRVPANPLDVLAQQVVAATSVDEWDVDELFALVRRAAPFASLPRSAYDATLDLLRGRYPSDEFAELRPRIVWDRVAGTLTGRPGAQRLAVTSGGTIPDRGLFGVFLVGEKASRVGELDEEMVYESRVGDVFALGATSWRIEDITHDRVLVSPAPGQPGRLPFWKGDQLGRPAELGAAIGAFTRELGALGPRRTRWRAAATPGSTTGPPTTWCRSSTSSARRPACCPPTARAGRAVPRRARRLAARGPLAVRRAGARAVGAGDRRPAGRALRHRRPGAARRRRHRAAHPRDRPGPARRRGRGLRARRDRGHRHHRGRRLGAVRLPLPRVRGPGAAAAAPRPGPPLAAVAAAPALGPAARGRLEVPVLPDRARGGPRVPPGRLRRAGAGRA